MRAREQAKAKLRASQAEREASLSAPAAPGAAGDRRSSPPDLRPSPPDLEASPPDLRAARANSSGERLRLEAVERARARSELPTPDPRRSDLEAEELALPASAHEWLVQIMSQSGARDRFEIEGELAGGPAAADDGALPQGATPDALLRRTKSLSMLGLDRSMSRRSTMRDADELYLVSASRYRRYRGDIGEM